MQIKLDASAVRALINDNEAFAIELQSCVIAEVVRKTLTKYVSTDVRDMIDKEISVGMADIRKRLKGDLTNETELLTRLSSGFASDISEAIHRWQVNARSVLSAAARALNEKATALIIEETEAIRSKAQEDIRNRMSQELSKVLSDISAEWKRQATDAIRKDVMTSIMSSISSK